ncbi:ADP-ribosylglycohydrolase family protein [Candidatus Woesearchaeota archaeon]|nr:ADP-ribosylglycohydrolase family protein [Candidatus Woesearchaeota archaeon]
MIENNQLNSKFLGCIIGGAIGDALGMPVEGIMPIDRTDEYRQVTQFMLPFPGSLAKKNGLRRGYYTDDTQLTILTIESIVEKCCVDFSDIASRFTSAYKEGQLRLLGRTTRNSLKQLSRGVSWKDSGIKDGAGNGPATRVAPVALYSLYASLNELSDYIFYTPIITHADPKAIDGTKVVLYVIRTLIKEPDYFSNKSNEDFLDGLSALCFEDNEIDTMKKRIIKLKEIIGESESIAFSHLQTTGYMLDTVQTALYCFLKHRDDFEKAVLTAVNNSYDSDSIAAITGFMSGAYLGINNIPMRFKVGLENYQYLNEITQKLYKVALQGMENISALLYK